MTHFNILVNGQVEETEISKSDKVGFTFEMLFDIYNKRQDKFDTVQLTKWTQGEKELTILKQR